MKITIGTELPDTWKSTTPIRVYETRFLSLGFRRYNIQEKTISRFLSLPDGSIAYEENKTDVSVFSRGYATECARVTVYSTCPHVWMEETSPYERFIFIEKTETVL
jgi:hypothetical protein